MESNLDNIVMSQSWKTLNDSWNNAMIAIDNANILHNSNIALQKTKMSDNTPIENVNIDEKIEAFVDIDMEELLEILKINAEDFKVLSQIKDIDNLKNMTKLIGWLVNNCDIDGDNPAIIEKRQLFIKILEWICNCLKYFINELDISMPVLKTFTTLHRSSYKLCQQKANCMYQYPDDINSNIKCKHQHYPYANLYIDCKSIHNYIISKFDTVNNTTKTRFISALTNQNEEFNMNEFKRCLITINFVINVTYKELQCIIIYRSSEPNFNIRKYHKCKVLQLKPHENRVKHMK